MGTSGEDCGTGASTCTSGEDCGTGASTCVVGMAGLLRAEEASSVSVKLRLVLIFRYSG